MAVVVVLRTAPGVGHHVVDTAGAAVEEGTQANYIDPMDQAVVHHDIVGEVVVKARRMVAEGDIDLVGGAEKVLHMVDVVEGIDLGKVLHRIAGTEGLE